MEELNTEAWQYIGETKNGKCYIIERDIMAAVPHLGIRDTAEMAREATTFQNSYWHQQGHGGVVLIFTDRLASLDKDARRVYQETPDPAVMHGAGLVGFSLLARAVGSFFLGISKPRIPLKMLKNLEDGVAWARATNAAANAKREAR